jgi:uracil-DNA glycosylase
MSELDELSQGDLFAPPDPILTAGNLDELHGLILRCVKCDELAEYRSQAVPGVGPANARVFFIGEAPGRWEDEKGEPFVGDAGAYLTELLEKIGLKRSEVFISNIVKCRPPENRNPKTPEMEAAAKPRRRAVGGREVTFLPLLHPAFGIRRQDLKPEIEKQFWKIRELLDES